MTNPCPHARSAAEFITTRAVLGVEKYGHTLADAGLSPAQLVRHAREEAADLLVYLTALEDALSWQPIDTAPPDVDLLLGWMETFGHRRWVQAVAYAKHSNTCHPDSGASNAWSHGQATHWLPLPPGPEPEPERSGYYECLSDKPSGTWDDAFGPEPARPAVTREAVVKAVTESRYTNCPHDQGNCCAPDKCPCAQTIDAIMALIGGAP